MNPAIFLCGKLCLFVTFVWGMWRLALRVGPHWLRRGEGPLWLLAAMLPLAIAVVAAGIGDNNAIVKAGRVVGARSYFTWLSLGTLLLLGGFVLLRLMLGATRHATSLWRTWFLVAGVLPDRVPLRRLQSASKLISALLTGSAMLCGIAITYLATLPQASAALGSDGLYPALAGLSTTVLMGAFLSYVHPSAPWHPPLPETSTTSESQTVKVTLAERVTPLLRWMGAGSRIEVHPSEELDRTADLSRLYPFQAECVESADDERSLVVVGPTGSGRTTAAVLMAVQHICGRGESALFIVPTQSKGVRLEALIDELRNRRVEAGSITVGVHNYVGDADIWVATPQEVFDRIDRLSSASEAMEASSLLHRLGALCIDDLEDFSGPTLVELRYLVFRLQALLDPSQRLKVTLISALSQMQAQAAARHVLASDDFQLSTHRLITEGLGPTRQVQRYMFRLGSVHWDEQSLVPGPRGLAAGARRLARQASNAGQSYHLDMMSFLPGVATPVAQGHMVPDVCVLRIDGNNAAEVLKRGRRYRADSADPVFELVAFANDPVSRWLELNALARKPWPRELPQETYPRVLAHLPGNGLTAEGARTKALHHLALALRQGPQPLDRLNRVFSPDLVREFRRLSGQNVTEAAMWAANDKENPPYTHGTERSLRTRRGRTIVAPPGRPMAALHVPATGETFQMARSIINYEAPPGSIVRLGESWFSVAAGDKDNRVLTHVQGASRTASIRNLTFDLLKSRTDATDIRYVGHRWIRSQRWQVQVHLTHLGTHNYSLEGEARRQAWRRTNTEMLDGAATIRDDELITEAWVVSCPDAPRAAMHTLVHVIRDSLDYFFLGASDFLGVAWQQDLAGYPALVFYERAPGGNGGLEIIGAHSRQDLSAMLRCAHRLLSACVERQRDVDGAHACGVCCYSASCSNLHPKEDLDAVATRVWLEGLLTSGGRD